MLRGRPAVLLRVLAVLAPLVLIYWQDLEVVATDALNSEVMNYILVIPFFIVYAIYRKRRMLQAVIPAKGTKHIRNAETVAGVSLLLTAFIIYWYGSYRFYAVEYHLFTMPIFLAGAVLLVYNWRTLRQLIFPLTLLFFLEPFPLQITNMIGYQMSTLSSIAAYNLLKLLGLPVTLTLSQTPIISIETVGGQALPLAIDVACSGLYSLTGFAAFAIFAAFIMRGAMWKRGFLFSLGFPLIYGLNILRISSIVWIGYGWGEGAAMQVFHLIGGSVLIFIATFLLLTLGDKIGKLRIFSLRASQEPCPFCNDSLSKGESFCLFCGRPLEPQQQKVISRNMVEILGVVAIALLIIPIQIPPFPLARGTADIDLGSFSAEELKNKILPTIDGWNLYFLYRDRWVEQIMKWDAALVYYYQKQGSNESQPIIFILIQIQNVRHTWEESLYIYPSIKGWQTATMLGERDIDILNEPKIMGRFLEFMRAGSTTREAVVYWFEKALFESNGTAVSRYVQISLDAYPDDLTRAGLLSGPNDVEGIQALLLPIARSIATYWQPLKTWTLINLKLGEWGLYIIILTNSPCILMLILLYVKLGTDRKRNASLFNSIITLQEKELLEALSLNSSKGLSTGKAIKAKYNETTYKDIEPKVIIEALEKATESSLINKDIANVDDNPILIWKSKF